MELLQSMLDARMWSLVASSTWQTIVMVFLSTIFSMILGLPIGVLLHVTSSEEQGGIIPHPVFYNVLSRIVNILRSFPFIILMIVLMPLSRIIIGTSIFKKLTVMKATTAVLIGSVIYKACVAVAIRNFEPQAMKLITAVLFLVILIISMERRKKVKPDAGTQRHS